MQSEDKNRSTDNTMDKREKNTSNTTRNGRQNITLKTEQGEPQKGFENLALVLGLWVQLKQVFYLYFLHNQNVFFVVQTRFYVGMVGHIIDNYFRMLFSLTDYCQETSCIFQ